MGEYMTERILSLIAAMLIFLSGCGKNENINNKNDFKYTAYNSDVLNAEYNGSIFYRNDLSIQAADPSIVKITDKEHPDYGMYYMYCTTEYIGCGGFYAWRSCDLHNWEVVGNVFRPHQRDSFGVTALWGPCVTYAYDETVGKNRYFMYYCASDRTRPALHGVTLRAIGLAVANQPEGPFVQWTGTNSDGEVITLKDPIIDTSKFPSDRKENLYNVGIMDASLFIDDDGTIYLYFIKDAIPGVSGSMIWGIRMKDFFTPDYQSAVQITRPGWSKVNGGYEVDDEALINEAPDMIKHNGKYYLVMACHWIGDKAYQMKQVIGLSPLDENFEKVPREDGGIFLTAVDYFGGETYDFISSPGSLCFIHEGNELFIAYQEMQTRVPVSENKNGMRGIAIDRISFVKNGKGEDILYTNGPTWSIQPLPGMISGRSNIISEAVVTATEFNEGHGVEYLTDNIFKNHNYSFINEFESDVSTTIDIEFKSSRNVSAIMIYNSFDGEKVFEGANIKMYGETTEYDFGKLDYDMASYTYKRDDKIISRPGGSIAVAFDGIMINKISIIIESKKTFAISDIVVLGE